MPNQKSKLKNQKYTHEFSAGFILFRQSPAGPLFLLLDYGQHWDFPKGHLEHGETNWQAAVRELAEETALRQLDRIPHFEHQIHYHFQSKKIPTTKTVTFFLAQTRTEPITLSHEHTAHAWLPYEDALERLTYQNAKDLLTTAHQTLQHRPRT